MIEKWENSLSEVMNLEPLLLDKKALEKLGLHCDPLYIVEYDLPRESERFTKETNKFVRHMRYHMVYTLRYKLRAIRNLDSSWFIDEARLDDATESLEEIRSEYLSHETPFDMNKRIRIIPVFTTPDGFESYEDRKAEYMLQLISEAQEKVDEGLKDGIMSETKLWRCKQTLEHIDSLVETLEKHRQYKLIQDSLVMLTDSISKYENMKQNKHEIRKAQKKQK